MPKQAARAFLLVKRPVLDHYRTASWLRVVRWRSWLCGPGFAARAML